VVDSVPPFSSSDNGGLRGGFFTLAGIFAVPKWVFKCTFNVEDCANDWPHSEQLKGFSLVWVLICSLRVYGFANDLLQ
jgi:hypothetical protein